MEFHKTLDWAYSMTLTYRFAAVPKKYEHIDFTPPKSVAEAAAKGLEYRQKASPSNKGGLTPAEAAKQGIGSGVQRAVNLKNRDTISPEVIKQMRNFLSRAKKNSKIAPEHKAEPWNDKGYVAWLLWGGDPAVAWVDKIIGQMESADNKESKKAGFHKIIKPSGRIASTTGDGSGVGFFIPLSADLASQYGVKPEDTSPPHVTFLYVGKVASEQVPTLLRVAREVLQDTPPVFGVLNGVDSFVQEDKNQRVLYSRVVFSYDLKPLRDRLWAALTEAGFKVEQAFPNFTPHVTIEYRDGVNDAVLDSTHPSGSWDCRTIEVWGLPKKYAISLGKSGVARTASVLDLFGYGTLTTEMESVSVQPSPSFPVALSELPYDSFPENSSETTREELQFLMDLQIRVRPYMAQQIADTDPDPTFYLWRYCREQGLDPFNTLDAAKSVTPTIVQLKRFYNRARPYQLAIPLGFADFHPLTSTTAQTPAYPSGHTIQATLAALLLSDIYPEHSVKFAALARQVSLCRMAGGFHFPSDVFYGEQIAKAIHRGASLRVAKAKYKEKKQVPKTDGSGKTTVYVYSERQVANRQRQKAERLEDFKPALADLRKQVKSDLDSDDPKKGLIALAVGLIDATYERVGNEDSADNGHYGVTGWLRKHVTFKGNKAVIRYVGKSGVKHEKTVEDDALVGALKNCCEDKEKDEPLLSLGKHSVTADDVNKYLEPYGITAKDLRGLHANREMQNRLRKIRSEGPKLPRLRKERDPILKQEFKEALEGAAEAVGHEPATLRKQYLVPGIEEAYMKDGTVTRDLTTSARIATSVRRVPTSSLRLDPSVRAFFKRFAALFDAYPNLWVEGGGARDALLTFYADRAEGYERATRSMRDIDLVLIGGTLADKAQLLRQFGGVIKAEDLDIRAASLGQYFKTRDVGINEVALRPEVMLFTTKAVNDLVRGTVNPSGGAFDPKWQDFTPRVALRSVLFSLREGLDFPTNPMLREAVAAARPFDLLIHLYKAFDTGVEDEFYAVVRDNPHLSGTRSAEEALLALSKRVYDFDRTPSQQRTYDDARSLVFGDRWEQEGLRFATKSDAEREDEEAERLLKPEPKHKPPRNDLRRRRVQDTTENDPDAKQDAKDRSQNYKDAALAFLPLAVL